MSERKPRRYNKRSDIMKEVTSKMQDDLERGDFEVAVLKREDLKDISDLYADSPETAIERYNELVDELEDSPVFCGYPTFNGEQMLLCDKKPWTNNQGVCNGRCMEHHREGQLQYADKSVVHIRSDMAKSIYLTYPAMRFTLQEKALYISTMNWFVQMDERATPLDIMVLDRGLRAFINAVRMESRVGMDAVPTTRKEDQDFDIKFLKCITTLGLDRKFRLQQEGKEQAAKGATSIFDMMMGDDD
jgi:hypothetical protein